MISSRSRRRAASAGAAIAIAAALLSGCASTGESVSAASVATAAPLPPPGAAAANAPPAAGPTQPAPAQAAVAAPPPPAKQSFAQRFFGLSPAQQGPAAPTTQYTPDYFTKATSYCPQIRIQNDTENMGVYDRGHDGDAAFLQTLGSITRTARECTTTGTTLSMKVGIAGRVVAGPKGGPGAVTLPIRVAVVRQGAPKPLFSQLYKVQVTLAPPDLGSDFAQVADPVNVQINPDDHDLIIYVGFDEGKKPAKPPASG
jgi:hypothetical protein